MSLEQGRNGQWFGNAPVLLCRIVEGKTEHLVGSSAPFGGVSVSEEFEGERFREHPQAWWKSRGFEITDSPMLHMARRAWFTRDKGDAS
jgi:hypothetical protein